MAAHKLLKCFRPGFFYILILTFPLITSATSVVEEDVETACDHASTIARVRIDHSKTKAEWNERGNIETQYTGNVVEVLKGKTGQRTIEFSSKGGIPDEAPTSAAIAAKPSLAQCVGPNNSWICS